MTIKCWVELTKEAKKDLDKVPEHVVMKLEYWVSAVIKYGIKKVREVPGFHDEPLKGKRKGLRSIRLNKAYRAIYKERDDNQIHIISILEVNKHEY